MAEKQNVETIDETNLENNITRELNTSLTPPNWNELENANIAASLGGLASIRDWVRNGFQRFDKGNLGEENNSLNALPIWAGAESAKVPQTIQLTDWQNYGQIAFYVSSLPSIEHFLVFVDFTNENNEDDNFSPHGKFTAINLADNADKFEDAWDMNLRFVVEGIPDIQKRPMILEISPKQKSLDNGHQYRSFALVHSIRNGLAAVETNFAKATDNNTYKRSYNNRK